MGRECPIPYPERFHAALALVDASGLLEDSPADASSAQLQLSDETRLLLYALRQQAQQGANNAPKPWGWNVVESAKWTAWAQLGNMSKTEAMFRFVQQLEYDEPSWWTKAPQKEPVSDDLATAVEDPSPNCARNSEAAQSVPAALPPLEWLAAQPSNLRPCPRHDHAAIVLDGYMYVFGGLSRGRYRNDMWRLHLESMRWEEVHPGTSGQAQEGNGHSGDATCPPPCAGHALVAFGQCVLVVGGHVPSSAKAQKDGHIRVHSFDVVSQSWSELETGGAVPRSRGGHTATLVGSRLLVIGGETPERRALGDVSVLDMKRLEWSAVSITGDRPAPRAGHVAARMGTNQLAIYGGGTLASSYSDAWLLDLDALHWKPLDAALAPVGSAKKEADPEPRVEHAGAVVGGRWVVVGGAGDGRDCTGCRRVIVLSDAASPLTYSTDGEGAWGDGEAQEESVTRTASSSHIRVEGTGRDMQLVWQEGGTVEHGPLAAEGLSLVPWSKYGAVVAFGGYDGRSEFNNIHVMIVPGGPANAGRDLAKLMRAAAGGGDVGGGDGGKKQHRKTGSGLSVPMPGPDLERLELRTASKQVPAVPPVPPLRFPPSPALQPAHTQSVGRAENSGDDGSETSDSLSCSSDGGGAEGRAEREEQADFASRLLEAEAQVCALEAEVQRQREERAMIARSAEEMRQRCIALERDLEEARRREEEGRRRLEESERRRAELEAMVGGASAGRGIQGQGAMGPVNGEALDAPADPGTAAWEDGEGGEREGKEEGERAGKEEGERAGKGGGEGDGVSKEKRGSRKTSLWGFILGEDRAAAV